MSSGDVDDLAVAIDACRAALPFAMGCRVKAGKRGRAKQRAVEKLRAAINAFDRRPGGLTPAQAGGRSAYGPEPVGDGPSNNDRGLPVPDAARRG